MGRKSLVCGVGVNDFALPTSLFGKHTSEYKLWTNMLYRSHDLSFKKSALPIQRLVVIQNGTA